MLAIQNTPFIHLLLDYDFFSPFFFFIESNSLYFSSELLDGKNQAGVVTLRNRYYTDLKM